MLWWSLLALLIVAFDQLTKYLVVNYIGVTDSVKIIPYVLDFVYVKNKGAAFSFLADRTYGIIILSIISLAFCMGVAFYLFNKKPENKLIMTSMILMFSGALGNAIDRIFRQFVVDFIELKFITFPVFNIADISITVGAALFIIFVIFFDKKNSTAGNDGE